MRCRDFCRDSFPPKCGLRGFGSIAAAPKPTSSARSRTDARHPSTRASCGHALRLPSRSQAAKSRHARARDRPTVGGNPVGPDREPTFRGNPDAGGKSRRRSREMRPMPRGRAPDGRRKSTTPTPLHNRNLATPRSSFEGSSNLSQTTPPPRSRSRVVVKAERRSPTSAPAWRRPAPWAWTPLREPRLRRLVLRPSIARRPAPCPA